MPFFVLTFIFNNFVCANISTKNRILQQFCSFFSSERSAETDSGPQRSVSGRTARAAPSAIRTAGRNRSGIRRIRQGIAGPPPEIRTRSGRHPNPPFVTFRKTSPDKPILDQERTGSESDHRAKQPWPVPAQNPPSPVVSAPRIGQAHRLSAIPRPETVCQPATQHFRQKETDKREQAAEQTDETPIAYGRNTKARPRRCRQHVLVPTAGTRRKSPRDDCKHTHRK